MAVACGTAERTGRASAAVSRGFGQVSQRAVRCPLVQAIPPSRGFRAV
ncbi:hypothetical protein ACOBQX_21010 [Actinokineospora sp. G85]